MRESLPITGLHEPKAHSTLVKTTLGDLALKLEVSTSIDDVRDIPLQ